MNRLEQMYARLEKAKIKNSKSDKEKIKQEIKRLEKISLQFHACGDLFLLQAKKLKENL